MADEVQEMFPLASHKEKNTHWNRSVTTPTWESSSTRTCHGPDTLPMSLAKQLAVSTTCDVMIINSCPESLKETAYKALVRSNSEYAPTIWDPYFQKDVAPLEPDDEICEV